jgi:hypothetical protein
VDYVLFGDNPGAMSSNRDAKWITLSERGTFYFVWIVSLDSGRRSHASLQQTCQSMHYLVVDEISNGKMAIEEDALHPLADFASLNCAACGAMFT